MMDNSSKGGLPTCRLLNRGYPRIKLIHDYCVGYNVNNFWGYTSTRDSVFASIRMDHISHPIPRGKKHSAHPVWETHIAASTCASVQANNLFVKIAAALSNPNNEWSVNTVLGATRLSISGSPPPFLPPQPKSNPNKCACNIASCPREESDACA